MEIIEYLKKDKRLFLVLLLVLILILTFGVFFLRSKNNTQQKVSNKVSEDKAKILKDVQVEVNPAEGKENTILLLIKNIPEGTEMIEYELTYETEDKGLQGVIGTLDDIEGKSYEKEIFLGTCSSGVCVPHKVKGSITLLLRFAGSYGDVVFEKSYEI